jgi:HEAT repeat protein
VAVRVDSLMADGDRLLALDDTAESLLIEADASAQIALTSTLAGANLQVILGDLLLLGAVPALQPLALLVERGGVMTLEPLPAASAEALLGNRKRRSEPAPGRRPRWIATARELGVSSAAIVLGEVREELADIFTEGLSALTSRRADGLVERLRQLGLAKPADLLEQTARQEDPAEKIEAVVRLLQVLGIGLSRLAASRNVDRARLVPSPLHPAIKVFPPQEIFDADGLIQELHAHRLSGHGRAIAIDRALRNFDEATLVRLAPTLFGDGSVASLVAERYATIPQMALQVSRHVLEQGERRYTMKGWSAPARVARYTAVKVLERLASPEARSLLKSVQSDFLKDPAMQNLIRRAVKADSIENVPDDLVEKMNAGNWETRTEAVSRIVERGLLSAVPHIRRIAATDPSSQVRYRAWYAQAALLDVDAVPLWMAALKNRASNEDAAREALHALAHIGDNRSIAPLLDAFEEGYKPTLVAEALRAFGPAIVPPLMDRLEGRPELLDRKVTIDIGAGVELLPVQEMLTQRLGGSPPEKFASDAVACLKFFSKNEAVQKAVVAIVQGRLDREGISAAGDLKRALSRAIAKGK